MTNILKTVIASTLIAALLTATTVQAEPTTGFSDSDASTLSGQTGEAKVDIVKDANFYAGTDSAPSWGKIASCTLNIGAFVAGNAVAVGKLREAGGVVEAAKKILTAEGSLGKTKAIASVFGEAVGIQSIVQHCS